MTATPASGSTFGGWSGHADCADASVTVDGDRAWTATFRTTTTPVTGACLPTTAKTFVPCAVPADGTDGSPHAGFQKDQMWTWDSKRKKLLVGMGDSTNSYSVASGNQVLWSYDAGTNAWGIVSTVCHPQGQISPNHPTDFGIMVYDSIRDRVWWLGQGDGYPPGQEGHVCGIGRPEWPKGSVIRNGFLWLNPETNTWTKVSEQATDSTGGAYFDAAGDRILNIDGNDGRLTAWAVANVPPTKTAIAKLSTVNPAPSWTGATGGWTWPENPNRVKWAWDPVGRIAYVPVTVRRVDVAGNRVESGVWMVTVNAVTGAVALKARAPIPDQRHIPDPYMMNAVWDSVNRRVIVPTYTTTCAQIKQMLVYDPVTDTWEDTPVPMPRTVHGYTIAYDPERNVVSLAGHEPCEEGETPGATRHWLWRYAP
jgi:hypothetical protein